MRAKIANVLSLVREHARVGKFVDTRHAELRKKQRQILTRDIVFILLNGYHEKKKDQYDERYKTWNYAIRGKLKAENKDIRVVISFDDEGMLIITAIELG